MNSAANSCTVQIESMLQPFSDFWNSFKTSGVIRQGGTNSSSALTVPTTFTISKYMKTLKLRENSETQVFLLCIAGFLIHENHAAYATMTALHTPTACEPRVWKHTKGTGSVDNVQRVTCRVTPAVLGSRIPNCPPGAASPHNLQCYYCFNRWYSQPSFYREAQETRIKKLPSAETRLLWNWAGGFCTYHILAEIKRR